MGLEKAKVWQSELGTGGPSPRWSKQNWELVGLEKAKVE